MGVGVAPAPPSDRGVGLPPAVPPYLPAGWRRLHRVARGLIAARALRSIAQGALAADFVLYLRALHWPAAAMGGLLSLGAVAGGAMGLAVGPVSDRLGRRPFLLLYQAGLFLCTLWVLLDPQGPALVTATLLFGYGLGGNGAAGPFSPAEQAWLARHVPALERGAVFSLNAAVGFLGMGIGSFLAGLVPLWQRWLPGPSAYLPLFGLTLAVAAVNAVQIWRLPERRTAPMDHARPHPGGAAAAPLPEARRGVAAEARDPSPSRDGAATAGAAVGVALSTVAPGGAVSPSPAAEGPSAAHGVREPEGEAAIRRRENRGLALLVGTNAVNALGIGLFGPLLPYWFSARFGAGAGAIGSVFGLTFVLTAVASIVMGAVADRVGLVRAVVAVRLVGVALLACMPFMPTFAWAAGLYAARSVLNRGSVGARQAFGVSMVRDQRRGLASSLNNVSWSLPSAAGPALAGWMMSLGSLDLPLFLAAALQLAYAILFGTALRPYDPTARPRPRPVAGA
jgi:MFS family permease